MKGMPLPFDFEGKGVLDLELIMKNRGFFSDYCNKSYFLNGNSGEPTSVLDSARVPSRPSSSSTLSSSFGGGGGGGGGGASTDTAGVLAVSDTHPSPKWLQDSATATSSNAGEADTELLHVPPSLELKNTEKCDMEDWECVFSGSVAPSPSQEQSFFRWIMGDVEDPALGSLNKVLKIGGSSSTAAEFESSGGFGVMDQSFSGDQFGAIPTIQLSSNLHTNIVYPSISNNLGSFALHQQPTCDEMKSPIYNQQLLLNQNQTPNSLFFSPLTYPQHQEPDFFAPPRAKRLNSGSVGGFLELPGDHISKGSSFLFPQNLHQKPIESGPNSKIGSGEQQAIDQLYKVAELVQTGNPILAQGILARLNHQFSPIGKPFQRAAFYCKEALQMLLHTNNYSNTSTFNSSPYNLVFKIGAYKAFSEISPLVQFANFTSNQAILEALDGFDRIHIVDFDIGYGGQWASFIHELASRGTGVTLLKITAVVSPSTHDQMELGLTRENLIQFAREIHLEFDFEVMSVDSLNSSSWSPSFLTSGNEAVAVNLPFGSFMNHQLSIPLVLHRIKQLSPRIVASVNEGCDRTDLSFSGRVIHSVQSYSSLLESLDAISMNANTLQKIERFWIQPGIQKSIMGHFRTENPQHWRSAFLSSGFTPVIFSDITESQAEWVVKRTLVRGFHLEKDQSSLALCWQKMELISASAWRC